MTTKPTDPLEAETMRADMESEERLANQYKSERDDARRENARLRHALTVAVHCMENFGCEPSAINIAKSALAGEVKVDK